jgi:hypothetical protein
MEAYDGTTSLQAALEQLHGRKLSFDKVSKITGAYRERLNLPTGKAINTSADKLKIYQWERDAAITQSSLTELQPLEPVTQSSLEPLLTELNIIQSDNDAQLISELDLIQIGNDIAPAVEPITTELNIIHANNDAQSKTELNVIHNQRDKFININYRHADNSRHTVQIEQFYIDALNAIGITDIPKFVAENAGLSAVTKNVKRAIVDALIMRVR